MKSIFQLLSSGVAIAQPASASTATGRDVYAAGCGVDRGIREFIRRNI